MSMLTISNVKVEGMNDLLTRGQISFISTGSKNLDTLLGGGIPTHLITEFHGEFGTGKTQIAHQLSVSAQLPKKKGGLNSPVIYIDTEGTFRPEKLIKIAKYLRLNPNEVLKNVHVASVRSLEQQNVIFQLLPSVIREKNAKIVIVDTLVSNIRTSVDEKVGNQLLLLKYLGMQLRILKEVAYILGAAVVVFNPISMIPEGKIIMVPGGSMLSENMDIRVLLKKVEGIENNIRVAELIQTPLTKEGSVRFMITEEGIKDV
ncbi:MAG: ATPase domain-containing protein [Thermoprotei archaeon]